MAYKHDYDKALTRLRIILQKLNDSEHLSVKDLANEFGVSTRTIQRDFNEKLVSNYPIYQENKKWKMQDGFKIEKIRDIEDKIVLDILEKINDGIGGNFAQRGKKLLNKIKNNDNNPIYTKLNIEDISDKLKEIEYTQSAIKDKSIIKCNYKINNKSYNIVIKPLKIANYEGFWYLLALDNRNDKLKKYYFKNISNIILTKDKFTTDNSLEVLLENSISIWFQKDVEPFEVKLFANKFAAKYFKRRPLANQIITSSNEDGTMEFTVKITHEKEILPIIKYWIPNLYVIEPKYLADIVKEDLQEYISNLKI